MSSPTETEDAASSAVVPAGLLQAELTGDQIDLMKRTILSEEATDDELDLFVNVCNRTGLNPFAKQIYGIHRWNNAKRRKVMTIQVSIDGLRLIAERTHDYLGQTEPEWCGPDGVWVDVWLATDYPKAARVGVHRKGFLQPLKRVALWSEYVQTDKNGKVTSMWTQFPTVMLAKVAEAGALRAAFPAELAGVYSEDEMSQSYEPPPVPGSDDLPGTGDFVIEGIMEKLAALPDDARDRIEAWWAAQYVPAILLSDVKLLGSLTDGALRRFTKTSPHVVKLEELVDSAIAKTKTEPWPEAETDGETEKSDPGPPEPGNLTPAQKFVVDALLKLGSGNMGQIAEALGLKPGARELAATVAAMRGAGLLTFDEETHAYSLPDAF